MTKPTLLLEAHLKALRLPTFLREYDKVARHCAQEGLDCPRYLFRLCELELLDREQRATERRIKAAKLPVLKSLETFEFRAIPSVNKRLVLELTRSEYLDRRENVLALGNSGTGKTHLALALGLAACQKGYRVRFTTAAALVNELLEARDDKRLLRVQKQLAKQDLLIVDELGYVPLSKTGAERLFEIFSQRYEQASTLVTSNLPFNEWTEIFGSERLTGALLDRLTHHVHILELNGESYRLEHSKKARPPARSRSGILTSPPTCRLQPRHSTAGWSSFPPPRWSTFAPTLDILDYLHEIEHVARPPGAARGRLGRGGADGPRADAGRDRSAAGPARDRAGVRGHDRGRTRPGLALWSALATDELQRHGAQRVLQRPPDTPRRDHQDRQCPSATDRD